MRTLFTRALLIGLAALAISEPAMGAGVGIPASARAALLAQARAVAAHSGDRHPHDIQAVLTTRLVAEQVTPGSTRPNCESMPSCADATWYIVAMRGHFHCDRCSPPRGARIAPGTVITLEIEAKEPLPPYSVYSLGDRYPNLAAAGAPVRLDVRRQPDRH